MKSILFAAAAACALCAAAPAFAADADADSAATVDEVVVTGRAGTEAQRRVEASYAVTMVPEEKLRLQASPSVAEVLKNVPGYWVEASGGVGGANIRARGIPIEGYAAVGLQENGLPIQHDGGLGFLNTDFSFRMDESIERVDVVRGGPSSIFASYAPAGIVNFVTRQPTEQIQGLVRGEVGDYGLYRGEAWLGGTVAGFRTSVSGYYRKDDGVREPGWDANKGGQFRAAIGRDFEHGSIDFDVKHTDDKTIFFLGIPLTSNASRDPAGLPGFDPNYGTLAGPETARLTFRTGVGPYSFDQTRGADLDLTQYTLRAKYDLGGWLLSDGFRYHDTTLNRASLFPNTPLTAAARIAQDVARGGALGVVAGRLIYSNGGQAFDVANQNGNGLVMDAFAREQDITLKEWINDLRVQRLFDVGGQSHDVTFGFYYAKAEESFYQQGAAVLVDIQDNARRLDLVGLNAAGQTVANFTENGFSRYGTQFNNASGKSESYALYAADEWSLSDKLRLDLGARWERIEMTGRNERSATANLNQSPTFADDNAIVGAGVFDALDRSFDGWSGTIALNYQFQPDIGAYARYTRAFRLPSLGDFITNPTNTAPRTQKFNLAEAGVKIVQPKFNVFLTAFYSGFDSVGFTETRYDQPTNSYVSFSQFAATQAYGFELEAYARPTEWFDASLNATVQDATLQDFIFNQTVAKVAGACPLPTDTSTAGANCLRPIDFSGNQQVRAPKVSVRFTPGLNLLENRLRAELEVEYYGKRFGDNGNTQIIPDYYLLNAHVRYNVTDHLSLFAYGENLTNEIGLTERNPRAGQFIATDSTSEFYIGRPELGRAFRAAVLYRF